MLSPARSHFLLLALPALAFGAVSCKQKAAAPLTAPKMTAPDLVFDPPRIWLDRVFPGKYRREIQLKNTSTRTIRNISVQTSCFCVALKDKTEFDALAPGESVKIPFEMEVLSPTPINQLITVSVANEKREYHMPIRGQAILPLTDITNATVPLSELTRPSNGQRTNTVIFRAAVAPETKKITLVSRADWLHLSAVRKGGQMEITAFADDSAPEGNFTAPARLEYTSEAVSTGMDIALTGAVASAIRAEPPLLSFGLAHPHDASLTQSCAVHLRQKNAASITAQSDNPQIQVTRRSAPPDEIRFDVRLLASATGEVQGRVTLKQGDKTLAAVPVSAFISSETLPRSAQR